MRGRACTKSLKNIKNIPLNSMCNLYLKIIYINNTLYRGCNARLAALQALQTNRNERYTSLHPLQALQQLQELQGGEPCLS